MSKAKDRARAESGLIFRDGKLVNKDEWYAAHPTKEMLWAMRQPTPQEVEAAGIPPFIPNRYYCTACRRHHVLTSKVGKEHTNFYLEEA